MGCPLAGEWTPKGSAHQQSNMARKSTTVSMTARLAAALDDLMTSLRTSRSWIALLAAALVVSEGLPVSARVKAGQKIAKSNPSQGPTRDPDGGWPRAYTLTSGGSAVVYQPQVVSWEDRKHLVAWAAVSYEEKDAKQPSLGTVKVETDTKVSLDTRLVNFTPFLITESNFPSLSRDKARELAIDLQQAIPPTESVIGLDRVLAGVDKSRLRPSSEAAGLKADPPKIFSSTRPAILVIFDGRPVWSPIKDVDLKFAVNTNWDVFQHTTSKTFYLRNDATWLMASDLNGPWSPAGTLPSSFKKLPSDDNWKDVRANLPGKRVSAVPKVFVSFEPAELILITGEPNYRPVDGTSSLLWVSNTDSDMFRMGKRGSYYYLVAGRWFSAPHLGGPWTFATTSLPDDFKKIPVEHPRSRVLASVPGADQAIEAVLLASVPQTARVNKKQLKAPEVAYQGRSPEFKPIETTSLERAVNTDKDIIKFGDLYYMCFQGVWFVSRAGTGPWEVTTSVPKEIYSIPASSPSYHVTYVTVEKDDDDSDDWVTFAALAGYTGMMVAWGCAVWGTGWYYPPYVRYGGLYPSYFWYPPTYGFAAWYNPWTGTYGRGAAVYGPYGGAGGWAAYNPRTGTYARGGAVYGAYGSRSFAQAWNPRTGIYAQTRQGSNIYGNWGSSYVQRGDNWAQTGHVTNYARGTSTSGIRTSQGGEAITHKGQGGRTSFAKTGGGDVYAGHDGNVYRKQDGTWQKWNDGGWSSVQEPVKGGADGQRNNARRPSDSTGTPQTQKGRADAPRDLSHAFERGSGLTGNRIDSSTFDQLDRDWGARKDGNLRTREHQSFGGGNRQSGGSYRLGGGFGSGSRGSRGGGFRRR